MGRGNSPLRVLKNRNFFVLWIGEIISHFGDRLAQMALVGLYLKETVTMSLSHSVPMMRNLFFFSTLPVVIFAPLAGVYVDRWRRKSTLMSCNFLRAGLVLIIPLLIIYGKGMAHIYAVIFLVFAVTSFFTPARSAIIPNLVEKGELLAANSLSNITRMAATIGGVSIGGLVVAFVGVRTSFYLNSLGFALAGLAISTIKMQEDPPSNSRSGLKEVGRELIQGLKFIGGERRIKFVAASLFILMGVSGLGYVIVTVFVTKALGLGTIGLSILAASVGAAVLCGSLLYSHFGGHLRRDRVILASIIMAGIGTIILAQSRTIFLLSIGVGVIGLVASPIMIASYTLTQEITPDRIRGRVFAALEVVISSAFLIFVWLAGVLGSRIPPSQVFYLIGITLLGYAGVVLLIKLSKKTV
ncbi:MFS transporter [Candidatus Aerophobetes bacterium]|uniref:MFS transporter n=1 Tax=Aerophobetes bacterium TaxID=2030807 RepID=A0A523TB60_UNCAE|nr:MAG: MFS transporter [Candidatus Aerophobetes bacterium]